MHRLHRRPAAATRAVLAIGAGRAGRRAAAIASGTPHVVLAHGADRPDNARRLHALGLAEWLPAARWQVDAVAELIIRVLTEPAYRDRAYTLATTWTRTGLPPRHASTSRHCSAGRSTGPDRAAVGWPTSSGDRWRAASDHPARRIGARVTGRTGRRAATTRHGRSETVRNFRNPQAVRRPTFSGSIPTYRRLPNTTDPTPLRSVKRPAGPANPDMISEMFPEVVDSATTWDPYWCDRQTSLPVRANRGPALRSSNA
ncbi:glycosyltransferase [Catellatospora bangladeshensis]|uniref:glycosyltransferase n=1 Tax=Catellatospora bangladeshensis TaxID=310355 RepID=UPI0035713F84